MDTTNTGHLSVPNKSSPEGRSTAARNGAIVTVDQKYILLFKFWVGNALGSET
jgi:hypothetical protein